MKVTKEMVRDHIVKTLNEKKVRDLIDRRKRELLEDLHDELGMPMAGRFDSLEGWDEVEEYFDLALGDAISDVVHMSPHENVDPDAPYFK